ILERRFVETFARPEVQLNLIQQNNTTVNALSITISPEEVREIEAEAEPIRAKVREMMAAYRPALRSNGNGEGQRAHYVQTEPVKLEDLTPITAKEDKPEFWLQFASGPGERPVSKEVAVFVAATIANEAVGRGVGHQAITAFKSDLVTISD